MLLFGFASKSERSAFDALTGVSKVGPKLALAVLSTLSPAEVAECVGRNDVLKLSSVPGLGKKTAERLVLELRGKDLDIFRPDISSLENGLSGGGEPRRVLPRLAPTSKPAMRSSGLATPSRRPAGL